MKRHDELNLDTIEALIYRLFAEKQYALALLALVMVAWLLTAQFLLLRVTPTLSGMSAPPAQSERFDLACRGGILEPLNGSQLDPSAWKGKKVVIHLDADQNQCITSASAQGIEELVVGVTVSQ